MLYQLSYPPDAPPVREGQDPVLCAERPLWVRGVVF